MQANKRQCGAKTRSGKPCQNAPMANGRCRMHGGDTPVAQASPHYKTGKHSKYLGVDAQTDYNAAWTNERILELTDEIALLDMRVGQLLADVRSLPATPSIEGLIDLLDATIADLNGEEDVTPMDAIAALVNVRITLQASVDVSSTWEEIGGMIERRRKLVETERKQAEVLSEFVHRSQLIAVFQQIADASADVIDDRMLLNELLGRFRRIGSNGENE